MNIEPNNKKAMLLLRLGLAATLILPTINKFSNPEQSSGLMETLLGISGAWFPVAIAIGLTGIFLMLVTNYKPRVAGGLLSVFFGVAIISGLIAGGPMFSVGPAIWKDLGLLGGSLALVYAE